MLSSGLGIVGFSWASSPACTELETIVMHWLGSMSNLDESLLPFENKSIQDLENCASNLIDNNCNLAKGDKISVDEFDKEVKNQKGHAGGGVLLVIITFVLKRVFKFIFYFF
jgi:hypothetical protein